MDNQNTADRTCRYCGQPLKGRIGQKYCGAPCKSVFHNQHILGSETKIREINIILRKNRSALRTACPLGKATVRKDFLRTMGMDFRYYTHTYETKNKTTYYFCYDYGYSPITDQEKVLIIQWQPYMDETPVPVPPVPDNPLTDDSNIPAAFGIE